VGCNPSSPDFECYYRNNSSHPTIDDPNGMLAYAIAHQLHFKLWDNANGWLNENTGPTATDPDWALTGASNFKGVFNRLTNGCVVGNQGNGEGAHPQPILNRFGVGVFPVVDWSTGSGRNELVDIYDAIGIFITQNDNQGLIGIPVARTAIASDGSCGQTQIVPPGTSHFVQAFMVQ
jgi:hypothetical protein